MGPFSQVPGLAGYQQQVALNESQDNQQMAKLSQLMQLAQHRNTLQQQPEELAMRRQAQQAQMMNFQGQAEARQAEAQERQVKSQTMQRILSLTQEIQGLPENHPDRARKIQEFKILNNPEKAFDEPDTMNNPLGKLFKMKQALPPGDPRHAIVDAAIEKESKTSKQISPTIQVGADGGKAPVAYVNDQGVTVWGNLADARGRPAANFNTDLQGRLSQAKKVGATIGEETTKAQLDLPRVIQNAETAIELSDKLLKHAGFKQAVGASSMLGIQKVPGTKARDFMNLQDQVKGGAFLEAFNSLKGGGQITEIEGKKATDAIARMDNATSEEAYADAVKDFQGIVRKGLERAKMKASSPKPSAPTSNGVKFLGFE